MKINRFLEGSSEFLLKNDDAFKLMRVDPKSEHNFEKYQKFHKVLDILNDEMKIKYQMAAGIKWKNAYDNRLE